MAWLINIPRKPSSIEAALCEVKQAVEALKKRRQDVMGNETSLEYPRESRVEKYTQQISSLDSVLNSLDGAIYELRCYVDKSKDTYGFNSEF